MDLKILNKLLAGTAICGVLFGSSVQAKEIDANTAQMQAMDKITGKVSVIEVPVNGDVKFGSFSIVVRACKTRPPEETPENFAFVDVVDNYASENPVNIFRGWMMSSTPGLNSVKHPIYDVWLLKCIDTKVDKSKLLSPQALKDRDSIVQVKDEDIKEISVPAKTADKVSEQTTLNEAPVSNPVVAQEAQTVSEQSSAIDETVSIPSLSEVLEPQAPQLVPNENDDIAEEGAPKSLLNISNGKPTAKEAVLPEAEAVLEQEHSVTEENSVDVSPVSESADKTSDAAADFSDVLQDKARQHLPVTLDENNQLIDFEDDGEDENLLDLPESLKAE